jgi:hypothetical protein
MQNPQQKHLQPQQKLIQSQQKQQKQQEISVQQKETLSKRLLEKKLQLEIVRKYHSVEFGPQVTFTNDHPAYNSTPTVVWFLLYLIQLTRYFKVMHFTVDLTHYNLKLKIVKRQGYIE